jgi:hypothetical protein
MTTINNKAKKLKAEAPPTEETSKPPQTEEKESTSKNWNISEF